MEHDAVHISTICRFIRFFEVVVDHSSWIIQEECEDQIALGEFSKSIIMKFYES